MSRFNLVDEKWIPVRFLDGRRDELGIQETLLKAKNIAVIEDPSPLVTAALHRFLLAVLYRALMGPTDFDQAKKLFREGLPEVKIKNYLKKWKDRFYLFDEEYPFGQHPKVSADEAEPWTKLTAEYNSRSNKVLFDHTDTKHPSERTPAECARWIITTMNFSVSGGSGYYPSPSSNGVMCIPMGMNLEETLSYCLVFQNKKTLEEDFPQWERPVRRIKYFERRPRPKRAAKGFSDLYTWQPRAILLEPTSLGNVSSLRFIAGEGFENPSGQRDPMIIYRLSEKKGWFPLRFSTTRDFWRNFHSLLPGEGDDEVPRVMQNAIRLYRSAGSKKCPITALVLGLKNEPPSANLEFWRMERFVMPMAFQGDRQVRSEIGSYLDQAEATQRSLWAACATFARHVLRRGENGPTKDDIRKFMEGMPSIGWYWSDLENRFHEMLGAYVESRSPDDIEREWLVSVRNALRDAWQKHRSSVSLGDAWSLRALAMAEGPIQRKLKELEKRIRSEQEVA